MEVDGGDLMIVVRCVIADTFFEVIARGINGHFVFIVAEVTATALLVNRVEDVEELADTRKLVVFGKGMSAGEGGFDEARL